MDGYKKRTSLAICGVTTMLSCALLFSCNNEDILESNTSKNTYDNICFGISPDENMQARNGADGYKEGYTSDRFVLRSKDSADTLCVRAVVSDGICSSGFEKGQAVTRGVPVSKENFYDAFHVLAYWKKNGTLVGHQFYMDEDVTDANNDGVWSTANPYYWPGAGHTLQFYAWAPADAGFTSTPSTPTSTTFEYTVPQAAVNQKDIVVAKPDETDGAYNQAQPLAFKHVSTAVRFAFGNQMQPGKIKSVALKGVYNSGTYNLETSAWTLNVNSTDNFSQELNMPTTGAEGNGTAITSTEGTFMMLPQVLPENAMVEVVFNDQMSGQDRTLTASVANTEWKIGTTVTYKLSISPEYNMNIEVPENDKVQDAHYVSFPITVNVEDFTGNWTLTSNLPNDVFFTATQTDLQKQGYWIDEDKGQASVSGTGSGTFTYYVYATENVTDAARDIELQIKPTDNAQAVPATTTVQQLCPSWNGTLGCERIEDGDYPWGFLYPENYSVTYEFPKYGNVWEILAKWYASLMIDISGLANQEWVTVNRPLLSISSITINFSEIVVNNVATDKDDSNKNTSELYNYQGISAADDLMERLESLGIKPDKELPTPPTEFAARACAMKNKYNKEVHTEGGNTLEVPVLKPENLVWCLPAQNKAPLMIDKQFALNGDYWTSTTIAGNNAEAYKFTAGSSSASVLEQRDEVLHVRAVREK